MDVFVLNIFQLDSSSYKIINVESKVCKDLATAEYEMKRHSYEIFCDNDGDVDFDSFDMTEWDSHYYEINKTNIL